MIIVFFHVLYLLGKFIYRNYREDEHCGDDVEENIGVVDGKTCSIEENQVDESDIYSNFYDDEESSDIRFYPPAYLQRYQTVAKVLADENDEGTIRKVVDFGCSELGFFQHMKNTRGIEEILCVDVDKKTLEENLRKIEPLTSDYLACRGSPLVVHVLEGSVTDNDQYLENCDAVVCIELIEHLYPETCLDLPFNIFGFIQPKIAVFTTPNADFNVLFKRMTGFRHWDHKFEWTREQFQDWANNIVTRYPNYSVQFRGICAGPPGSEALGHCSQMAIFHRKNEKTPSPGAQSLFNLIKSVDYPYRIDERSMEEKTLQEAVYYIRHYSFNNDDDDDSMPLELLAKWIDTVSIPILKEILIKDGWNIIDHEEKGLSVLCPPLSEYSESNDINDDDYNHERWDEQSIPPAYQSQDWPEILDQDEENWDNGFDDSSISHQSGVDNYFNHVHGELVGNSIHTDASGLDFHELENVHDDNVFSAFDLEPMIMNEHAGTPGTSKDYSSSDLSGDSRMFAGHLRNPGDFLNDAKENHRKDSHKKDYSRNISLRLDELRRESVEKTEFSKTDCEKEKDRELRNDAHDDVRHDPMTLHSICSMYLQSSTCENDQMCPENITNPDFQLSNISNDGDYYDQSGMSYNSDRIQTSLTSKNDSPNSTSTPMKKTKNDNGTSEKIAINEGIDEFKNKEESFNCGTSPESSDNCRSCQREKFEVMRKLKGNSLLGNSGNDGILQRKLKSSLSLDCNAIFDTNDKSPLVCFQNSSIPDKKSRNSSQELNSSNSLQYNDKYDENQSTLDHFHSLHSLREETSSDVGEKIENFELNGINEISEVIVPFAKDCDDKALSEARGSPPNSWSPEIMDSGYPNTSSAHDITPEYDLSSIGQDRISESESPSLAEPPRQLEEQLEHFGVENGDLVNNNRDGEGNNVIPVEERDLEDFGPLIDVLENDLENENDIYDLENGFPVWLLRILDAEGVGLDAGALGIIERAVGIRDEGFGDDERNEVDENENVDGV